MRIMPWSARSPDLKPTIDLFKILWKIIDQKLTIQRLGNMAELKLAIAKELMQ